MTNRAISPGNTLSHVHPIVVGVTGHKRHGKDTVAKRLVDCWGFEKVAFADALKDACAAAFHIPRADFDDDSKKERPSDIYPVWTLRRMMQFVGTELFRSEWPNIWIDTWYRKVADKKLVVVTDLRFPNEEIALRQFPYNVLFRVKNERLPDPIDPHSSEGFIDCLFSDRILLNNSTVNDLWSQIDSFCENDLVNYTGGTIVPRVNRNQIIRGHFSDTYEGKPQ